jgi:hypothetical protein
MVQELADPVTAIVAPVIEAASVGGFANIASRNGSQPVWRL